MSKERECLSYILGVIDSNYIEDDNVCPSKRKMELPKAIVVSIKQMIENILIEGNDK